MRMAKLYSRGKLTSYKRRNVSASEAAQRISRISVSDGAAFSATDIGACPAWLCLPNERNSVMTQMGEARASKFIGSAVYSNHDEKSAPLTTS